MKNPNYLCLGCMNEWGHPDQPCPVCGFVQKKYEKPPRWLPLKHVLNGKYMIGKVIGEGGFGITYIGWDLNLQVRVAIKEYFPVGLATRETGKGNGHTITALPGVRQENYRQGLEKFMTEAKNLSKFYNLKGIVAVKDFFFENDTAYMVMEYVDGITLGKYLKDHGGQLGEQEVLQLFHPVMESLKIVHQSGIIHRDISPDNIMMTKDGQMKLIDFGAARFAGGDTERSLTIILKLGYAPAEQYQSHGNQGPWTDVYAICATMYRMITGKVPPSAMDRLHQDTIEEFDKLGFRVSTKTAYAVIDKGLAIRVNERYQNMDELIQGLYGMDSKKVHRKRKPQNQKMMIGLAAAACVVCLAVCGLLIGGRRENQVPVGDMQQSISQSSGEQKNGGHRAVLKSVSSQELKDLQKSAMAAQKKITAAGSHLVFLKDDGSVTASGTNPYENLNVTKWKGIQAVEAGKYHTVGIKEDGTAVAAGDTSGGKCAVDTWKTVVKASNGTNHTLGLREDGTVLAAGENSGGQCGVSSWTDIVDIAAGSEHSLGLKADGTVLSVGANYREQCEVSGWSDVVQIEARESVSAGLKSDGSVVMSGDVSDAMKEAENWKQVISIQLGKDYIAGLLSNKTIAVAGDGVVTQEQVNSWSDVEAIAAADETLFGMKTDGGIVRTIYSYGTSGKEDLKDLSQIVSGGGYLAGLKENGTVVTWGVSGADFGLAKTAEWKKIVQLAASADGIMGLRDDGTVAVIGENYKAAETWKDVAQIAMGEGIALAIKTDGSLLTAGTEDIAGSIPDMRATQISVSDNGRNVTVIKQDGTVWSFNENTDGVSGAVHGACGSNHAVVTKEDGTVQVLGYGNGGYANVYSWKDVVSVAAGAEHTVGLKKDGTLLVAGSNSNGQCDVSDWSDVSYIEAGDYYTLGIKKDGTLLIAGKIPGEY